jgi:hypothetical protein
LAGVVRPAVTDRAIRDRLAIIVIPISGLALVVMVMKRSSFQLPLWTLLILVLVAALDSAVFQFPLSGRPLGWIMLILGVLPMCNLLLLGLLITLQRPARRLTFWVGFELAGLLVLFFYAVSTIHHSADIRDLVLGALRLVGTPSALTFSAAGVALLLPQVLLACVGGCLNERVVTRASQLSSSFSGDR